MCEAMLSKDTMAKMEMECALTKLKLGPKKDPNKFLNKFASIECQYVLVLSESKEKAQILQLGGTQYSSIIATTLMIYHNNKTTLTAEKVLDEIHIQWPLAGGKSKEDKDSNNKDEIALAATNTKKGGKMPNGGGKPKKENNNKDKFCDHCNKKGHIKNACWEKYPEKKLQEFRCNSCD